MSYPDGPELAPYERLVEHEIEYLRACGWERDEGDLWREPETGRQFRHGHAVNKQKQLDRIVREVSRRIAELDDPRYNALRG